MALKLLNQKYDNHITTLNTTSTWVRPKYSNKKCKLGGEMTLLHFNKHPIEYKYYDSCNEIVTRLRLLVASQSAGKNGHQNEIVPITEELREAGK